MSDDIAQLRESQLARIMAAVEAWEDNQEPPIEQLRAWLLSHQDLWENISGDPASVAIHIMETTLAELAELRKFKALHTDHGGL